MKSLIIICLILSGCSTAPIITYRCQIPKPLLELDDKPKVSEKDLKSNYTISQYLLRLNDYLLHLELKLTSIKEYTQNCEE